MHKKKLGFWFQIPAIVVLIIVPVIGSFYVKISNRLPISWFTPIVILLIAVAYFYGRSLENKNEFSF